LPSLVFTTGQTDIDVAVNGVRAVLDTTGMNGPVPLAVRATDGSTNATTAAHDLIADNLAPAITITAPAMDGLFLRPPVTLGWSVVEANPMATTATLDTQHAVTPGFQVAAEGAHSLSVTATDRAGGTEHRHPHVHDRRRRARARQRERAERRRREAAAHDHGDRHRQLHGDGLAGS
jgi:hypothetical protein